MPVCEHFLHYYSTDATQFGVDIVHCSLIKLIFLISHNPSRCGSQHSHHLRIFSKFLPKIAVVWDRCHKLRPTVASYETYIDGKNIRNNFPICIGTSCRLGMEIKSHSQKLLDHFDAYKQGQRSEKIVGGGKCLRLEDWVIGTLWNVTFFLKKKMRFIIIRFNVM